MSSLSSSTIRFSPSSRKWQDVRKYIMNEITSGRINPGEALPSENVLCEVINVSRSTVRQAMGELENEGMVHRIRGKGTFLSTLRKNHVPQKTQMFGLIIPDVTRSLYPSLIRGFDHEQSIQNYQTVVSQSDNDVNKQGNIILQLLNHGINGLAIVSPTLIGTPAFQIEHVINAGVPVVACHRPIEGLQIPSLTWDREGVGRMAGKLFLERGHTRIAYFGASRYMVTEAHVRGLCEMLAGHGVSLPESRVIWEPASDTEEMENLKISRLIDLLGSKDRPTAILCNDDTEAERVYWVAVKIGMKVPADLSIIGFGDRHRDTIFRKMLTSVVIDEFSLGKQAAFMLHEIRSGKRSIRDREPHVIKLELNAGDTVTAPSY